MERIARAVRQNGMKPSRHVSGIVLTGLLAAAVAGCGSQVATGSTTGATATPGSGASGSAGSTSAVGCAAQNQATKVVIHRTIHLVEPGKTGLVNMTQTNPTLVRALFRDFCQVVSHKDTPKGTINCPNDIGLSYSGKFYDASRLLATFVYSASGCQTVSITASGKSSSSMVYGTAATAAPHLESDMAKTLGLTVSSAFGSGSQVNPGGPDKPASSKSNASLR